VCLDKFFTPILIYACSISPQIDILGAIVVLNVYLCVIQLSFYILPNRPSICVINVERLPRTIKVETGQRFGCILISSRKVEVTHIGVIAAARRCFSFWRAAKFRPCATRQTCMTAWTRWSRTTGTAPPTSRSTGCSIGTANGGQGGRRKWICAWTSSA